MAKYMFLINRNIITTLVGDFDNGGGYECRGTGNIWEISHLLLNFYVNLKLL